MLMMPDLYNYWLTGNKAGEYTIASTSQLLDARTRAWSRALAAELGIPTGILPPLVQPGTVLGNLRDDVMTCVELARRVQHGLARRRWRGRLARRRRRRG